MDEFRKKLQIITDERNPKGVSSSMTIEDSKMNTRLLNKNYSPLIVRKYQMFGWPLFIGIICDQSLSDLDETVNRFQTEFGVPEDDIQAARNFCGALSEYLIIHYSSKKQNSVEGIAILWYVDKCFISSLYGDFMVHASCKQELFSIIQTLPHI